MRRPFVAGNWKMNLDLASSVELAHEVADGIAALSGAVDVAVCPPYPYLHAVSETLRGSDLRVGAQNAYHEASGAFTGEVAVNMLLDVGCRWVILGHSERRHVLGETDEQINRKVKAALAGGLPVILCVGELLDERQAKQTEKVLDRQMQGGLEGVTGEQMAEVVIAYEPVWAIGTGLTATPEQAESTHAHLRNWLSARYNPGIAGQTRIQYGGSVKPDNAAGLMQQPNVDGALVGGASLKADAFLGIVRAAAEATNN